MNNKIDNEPYDRGRIAIHEDFYSSTSGFWLVNDGVSIHYTEEFYRWHVAQAQEAVDDIIYNMVQY